MKKYNQNSLYYSNRHLFGNKALFYVLVGGRGRGKTFSTMNYCLRKFFKHGEKFIWLRLTETSTKKLLQNNCADFIDSLLMEKWHIQSIYSKNETVYINGKEACRIYPLSTFFNEKGVALNKKSPTVTYKKLDPLQTKDKIKATIKKFKNIVLDEMNKEKNERKTFDISYAFVNQLENICRLDTDRRIILMGNSLEEASDILVGCFKFIPDAAKFGIHKIPRKKCIIDYIEDSEEFKQKRKESIAGMLAPEESTFTNIVLSDGDLVTDKKPGKPTQIIQFGPARKFSLHNDIITRLKVSDGSKIEVIAMQPYIPGIPFYKERAKQIIDMAQQRLFKFDSNLTLKLFYKEIKNL